TSKSRSWSPPVQYARGRRLRRDSLGRAPFPGGRLVEGQAQARQVGEGAAADALRRVRRRGRPPRAVAALTADPVVRGARPPRGAAAAGRRRALPRWSGF